MKVKRSIQGLVCALLASAFLFAGVANASCEDGSAMAGDAALNAARRVAQRCRLGKISDPKPTPQGEVYLVELSCAARMGQDHYAFRVSLHEVEDAMCTVESVRLLRQRHSLNDRHGRLRCPSPGTTINCMPPTRNPYCQPQTRQWIETHCPGVSYTD